MAQAATGAAKQMLQGSISRNTLVDALDKVGIRAIIRDGKPITLEVDDVHMGTAAFYGGVAKDDVIRHINQTPTTLVLTIERDKRIYQLTLKVPGDMPDLHGGTARTDVLQGVAQESNIKGGVSKEGANLLKEKPNSDAAIPVVDVSQRQQKVPEAEVSEQKKVDKILIKYDLEVIIDISGSMKDADGTGDISKFEWCHRQVRTLAERLNAYGKTLTITRFNRSFDVMTSCNPSKVEEIYATTVPEGATDLVDPLDNRMYANLNRDSNHPALIAIITDGLPNVPTDTKAIDRAIINYTQQLKSPNQTVLTFLQIGDTFDGKDFCRNLDDNLVREGAKYDIVDTKTFDELKREGLVDALIDAIIDNEKYGKMTPQERHTAKFTDKFNRAQPAQTDTQLRELQEERHKIEQQILQR
jgi:hypothetical protein